MNRYALLFVLVFGLVACGSEEAAETGSNVVEACTEASSPVCHADRDAAVLTPIDAAALDVLGAPPLELALDTLENGAALMVDGYHRCGNQIRAPHRDG